MAKTAKCPSCGATLTIRSGEDSVHCSCGKTLKVRRGKSNSVDTRESMSSKVSQQSTEFSELEPSGTGQTNNEIFGDLSGLLPPNDNSSSQLPGKTASGQTINPMVTRPKRIIEEEKPRYSPYMIWGIYGGFAVLVFVGLWLLFTPGKQPKPTDGEGNWDGSTYVLNEDNTSTPATDFIKFSTIYSDIDVEKKEILLRAPTKSDSVNESELFLKGEESLDNLAGLGPNPNLVMNYIPGLGKKGTGTIYWIRTNSQDSTVVEWQALTSHTRHRDRQRQVSRWLNSNPGSTSLSGNRLALHDYSIKNKILLFDWKPDESKRNSYSSRVNSLSNDSKEDFLDYFWLDEERIVTGDAKKIAIWQVPPVDSKRIPGRPYIGSPETTIKHEGTFFLLKHLKMAAIINGQELQFFDLREPSRKLTIPVDGQPIRHLVANKGGTQLAYFGTGFVVLDIESGKKIQLATDISDEEVKEAFIKSVSKLTFLKDSLVIEAKPTLIVDWKKGKILESQESARIRLGRIWNAHGSPATRVYTSTSDGSELSKSTKSLIPKPKKFRVEIDSFDHELAPKIGVGVKRLIHRFGGRLGEGEYVIKFDVRLGEEGRFSGVGAKYKIEGTPPKLPSIDFDIQVLDSVGNVCKTDKFIMRGSKSVRVRPGEVTWLTLKSGEKEEIIEKLKGQIRNMDAPGTRFAPLKLAKWLDEGT